ncbi:MAG: permease [Ignisphaera sp.]|nr:permease [Ignisphaera sp.]MDW8085707.1 permease [Ignisphaera sp.]
MSSHQWNRYYRIWVNHSIFYSFSSNISMVFHQAYAIRILGYSVDELGTLTFINLAFFALGNLVSPALLYRYRDRRVTIWKIFTSINIISWSLTGFSDITLNKYVLYMLVAIAQLSGAVGNLAYSDTIADMIPKEESVRIFSRANTLFMSSALVALVTSVALFGVVGPSLLSYRICYTAAFITALISTALLLMMRDLTRRNPSALNLGALLKGYQNAMSSGKIKSYVMFMAIFTFSVNLPGALWNYYIINVFKGSETWISINTITSTLALSIGSYVLNRFYHRIEPKRILTISIIPISLFPLLFLAAHTMTYQALINLFSGFSWSAFNLIAGIYNLYIAEEKERIYMLSMLGIASNLAAATSSKLGALVASISFTAMQSIFVASFVGRLLMYMYGKRRLPSI